MFGDEINAFVSLDLIYKHTDFLDPDLFGMLRMHLDHYFFKIEKRLVMTLLGIQIRSTMRHYDHIIKEEELVQVLQRKIMPMRLYFDNSYERLIRPWAIDTMVGPSNYFVNGVKVCSRNISRERCFQWFSKLVTLWILRSFKNGLLCESCRGG